MQHASLDSTDLDGIDLNSTDLEKAAAGDDAAFARLVAPLRAELHAHCYRMLGSVHDADDALQETLLRAWRGLGRFEGRSSVRTWMYAVATHSCLDAARGRQRRALPMDMGPSSGHAVLDAAPRTDLAWLGPYPDERCAQRESVELAFVAALQHLPGNQRAALLMADVLGYSAVETAALLGTTTAAVSSAVRRARATLGPGLTDRAPVPDRGHRAVVSSFVDAMQRGDADAVVALLARDVTWSMPPIAQWYRGRDAVAEFARAVPLGGCGSWRGLATTANNRPATALYLDAGDGAFRAWSITACAVRDGLITELTSFLGAAHFTAFALPHVL